MRAVEQGSIDIPLPYEILEVSASGYPLRLLLLVETLESSDSAAGIPDTSAIIKTKISVT